MTVTITPLGGIGEVGRNCVAVEVDNDIFICDMGFHLERFIEVTEDDYPARGHLLRRLVSTQAIPDRKWLRSRKDRIKGICISHAHLDHVGAIRYLAKGLDCPIYATKFAANVIRSMEERKLPKIVEVKVGATVTVNSLSIEFIRLSHSTPESCILAFHTPNDGIVVYANDYKNDQHAPFEPPTDVERIKQLSASALIVDSLYANAPGHCPSELKARNHVLSLQPQLENKRAIVVSTFSSHIYRIKSLIELAKRLKRTPIIVGRSLSKYLSAGDYLFPEAKYLKQYKYRNEVNEFLSNVSNPQKYFLIVTGHQGEPNAVLSRMANGVFDFTSEDAVVFSCRTIPSPITIENREVLENKLHEHHVDVIKDVHVSGHAHQEDHRDLLSWLRPKYVIPAHAEPAGDKAMIELVNEFEGMQALQLKLLESFTL